LAEALKQPQVVQAVGPTGTALQARAQPTKDSTAVVAVEMMETPIGSMPVEAAVVQAQWAQMSAIREGLRLVVPAAQALRTALPELHRVMPEVAEAGTPTRQQTVAQTISLSKVENVVPPWWVAQVHVAQMQLQVQPIQDLEAAAADSTGVHSITPAVLEAPELLSCVTQCPTYQHLILKPHMTPAQTPTTSHQQQHLDSPVRHQSDQLFNSSLMVCHRETPVLQTPPLAYGHATPQFSLLASRPSPHSQQLCCQIQQ
jgi:hypothetical protein